jgi:hypothetical protein
MRNDPPTNLRRGHGFQQARAAGAPYVNPRPGYAMDWDVNERRYEKELAAIVRRDPSTGALVRRIIEKMKTGFYNVTPGYYFEIIPNLRSSATLLCYFVLYLRPDLAPKDYWDRIRKNYKWWIHRHNQTETHQLLHPCRARGEAGG